MIQSNEFGTYGIVTDEPITWEVFCVLCEVVNYLNGQSNQVPNDEKIDLIPRSHRTEIKKLLAPVTTPKPSPK
jgi:glutathionyl-hydroquinone reductase